MTTLLSVKHTLLFKVLIALLLNVVLTVNVGGSNEGVVTFGLNSAQPVPSEG